ncbi:MAG: phosphoribosylformylglycinamidine synthase subunit PurS [bacterium]|nr:phosphoribosylformylglycinamidine synthase subunit PurS [bacterium]
MEKQCEIIELKYNMKKNIFLIEIYNKTDIPDVFGIDVMKNIMGTGISEIDGITTAELYRFEGDISLKEIKKIAEDVLVDSVIQEYKIRKYGDTVRKDAFNFIVDVFYKKGVTDAVAETVAVAVKDAGIKKDLKISTGKRYYIKGSLTKEKIELMCEKVLANRLVHDYSIELVNGEN